jgi:hypothetical protein
LQKTKFQKKGKRIEKSSTFYKGLVSLKRMSRGSFIEARTDISPKQLFPLKPGKKWHSAVKFYRNGSQIAFGETSITVYKGQLLKLEHVV